MWRRKFRKIPKRPIMIHEKDGPEAKRFDMCPIFRYELIALSSVWKAAHFPLSFSITELEVRNPWSMQA